MDRRQAKKKRKSKKKEKGPHLILVLKKIGGTLNWFPCFPVLTKAIIQKKKSNAVFSILKVHYASVRLHSPSHFIAAHDSAWWIGLLVTEGSRGDCYQMRRSQSAKWAGRHKTITVFSLRRVSRTTLHKEDHRYKFKRAPNSLLKGHF